MKQLSFFLLLCCSIACSSPNKIPDDVIGINEMKPIVWDMMRAGALTQNLFRLDSVALKRETLVMYQQVFNIYGITKDEFYKSYHSTIPINIRSLWIQLLPIPTGKEWIFSIKYNKSYWFPVFFTVA
jgi:Domain of unknown function (DUF4296)